MRSWSPSGADGPTRLWLDDALDIDMRELDLHTPGGNNFFKHGYVLGWSNSGYDEDTAVFVDDFRIYRSDPGW